MSRVKAALPSLLRVAKFVYQNRKSELALAAAVIALTREIVQAATGH